MQQFLSLFLFVGLIAAFLIVVWIKFTYRKEKITTTITTKEPNYHLPFCSDELALIVSFLTRVDIGNLSLVCREAKQIAYDSPIWNELDPISIYKIEGLQNSERFNGKLKSIHLTDHTDKVITKEREYFCDISKWLNDKFQIVELTIEINMGLLKFLNLEHLDCFENVKRLNLLYNSMSVLCNSSPTFNQLPKKLEYLKIRGFYRGASNQSEFESIFTQNENIKVIKFEKNCGRVEMKFKIPDVDLKNLTYISFSGTTNISTESFNKLMERCTNLKRLDLSNSTFSNDSIKIPSATEFLDISNCLIDNDTLTTIACLPSLKFVNLAMMLIPVDTLILYCKVGRCIVCHIASKEELQTLKSYTHICFTRLSLLDFDTKIKEMKHSNSFKPNICHVFYQQLFAEPIEPPKLILQPKKLRQRTKLIKI